MIEQKLDAAILENALARLASHVADLTPVTAGLVAAAIAQTEANFAAESGPDGKWPDLKEGTQAARKEAGTWPGKILQRTAGGLAGSVQGSHDANSATVGTNKVYAAIQQLGGKTKAHVIGAKNKKSLYFGGRFLARVNHPGSELPARAYLPVKANGDVQPEFLEEALAVIAIHLQAAP